MQVGGRGEPRVTGQRLSVGVWETGCEPQAQSLSRLRVGLRDRWARAPGRAGPGGEGGAGGAVESPVAPDEDGRPPA